MKMAGWLKALPIALAVAALSVITASCGANNGQAQVRMINAVADSQPLDIFINGAKAFANLAFTGVMPNSSPATYAAVQAGGAAIRGFPTGNDVIPTSPQGTVTLNGTSQYTMIAIGLQASDAPPLLLLDNNTVPVSGNVEFRIINVSPSSSPNGVDVYIVPPTVNDLTNYTPQLAGLGNGQTSNYQSMAFAANGYHVIVTFNGSKTPYITEPFTLQSGSIRTLVLVDNPGANNGTSQTPLILDDLN